MSDLVKSLVKSDVSELLEPSVQFLQFVVSSSRPRQDLIDLELALCTLHILHQVTLSTRFPNTPSSLAFRVQYLKGKKKHK